MAYRPFSKVQPNLQEVESHDESASAIHEKSEEESNSSANFFQASTSEVFKKDWNLINSIPKLEDFYKKNKENLSQTGQQILILRKLNKLWDDYSRTEGKNASQELKNRATAI